jgi:hypothetical protein
LRESETGFNNKNHSDWRAKRRSAGRARPRLPGLRRNLFKRQVYFEARRKDFATTQIEILATIKLNFSFSVLSHYEII